MRRDQNTLPTRNADDAAKNPNASGSATKPNLLLEAALDLAAKGFPVFPCKPGTKKPLGGHGHHDASTCAKTIQKWWTQKPKANVAIACGASGFAVVDVDPRNGGTGTLLDLETKHGALPRTVEAKTGGKDSGRHLYFRAPQGRLVGKLGDGVDLKHDGYVIVPPSIHPDGGTYSWEISPFEAEVAELPAAWIALMTKGGSKKSPNAKTPKGSRTAVATSVYGRAALEEELKEVANANEGDRNNRLNQAAFALGQLHAGGELDDAREQLVQAGMDAGLPEAEAGSTVESGWNAGMLEPRTAPGKASQDSDDADNERGSMAANLIEIACTDSELFHDERKEPYALVNLSGRRQLMRIWGTDFKCYLADRLYEAYGKAPGGDTINTALNVVEARARRGKRLALWNRVARGLDGAIWLDLGDGRAVRVTRDGWAVVDEPPPLFRQYPHQLPIPEPAHGGNFDDFMKLTNLSGEDQRLLFMIALVVDLIPDIPRPMKVLVGTQGSAKTNLAKMAASLIDPSVTPTSCLVDKTDEMMLTFDRHYMTVLDNVTSISHQLSDLICVVITGGAYEKRRLYTDSDAVLLYVRRPLMVTAVNALRAQPDLQDRSLVFILERIEKYRDEGEILAEFNALKPRILGAMLDMLVGAMREYDHVEVPVLPRMADFARWGAAVARACGIGEQAFLGALARNGARRNIAVIEDDAVGAAVLAFISQNPDGWEGTPNRLYEELSRRSDADPRRHGWPVRASDLTRKINTLKPGLADMGILVTERRSGDARIIILKKSGSGPAPGVEGNGVTGVTGVTGVQNLRKSEVSVVPPSDAVDDAIGDAIGDAIRTGAKQKPQDSCGQVTPMTPMTPRSRLLIPLASDPRCAGSERLLAAIRLKLKARREAKRGERPANSRTEAAAGTTGPRRKSFSTSSSRAASAPARIAMIRSASGKRLIP